VSKLLHNGFVLFVVMSFTPAFAFRNEDQPSEVKLIVSRVFDAMRTRDTDALARLFIPEGRLISTMTRNGKSAIRILRVADFAKMVAETKEPYRERMFDIEVRVEGDLATVWGRYDFHVGERLMNCGTNALQLLHTADGWKVVQITSTIRIENCENKLKK
jgi:uncharacterized protein (TIGR02246 family)